MYQTTWHQNSTGSQFGVFSGRSEDRPVTSVGTIYWEEHCVECSAPQCYSSCSLYVSRRDRRCARFVRGITPNKAFRGLFGFGADIQFRRWGKLEAIIDRQMAMYPAWMVRTQAGLFDLMESLVSRVASAIERLSPTRRLNGAFNVFKRASIRWQNAALGRIVPRPDSFYLKCFSPESKPFKLQLEVANSVTVFRAQIPIVPGWNEHVLDAKALLPVGTCQESRIRISVEDDAEVHVIFTWLDFVRFPNAEAAPAVVEDAATSGPSQKVKCVAWDLDNTLWSGVIGDSGADGVRLNPAILELIHEFDRRGILQTIVSKNTYATAWSKIQSLGLDQYFLYPAIHWGPKSESVRSIAKELNINPDTFAVIDDSDFERAEIRSALPQVRVFDPRLGLRLLNESCFDVPVTAESGARRQSYQTEAARRAIHANWRGNFDDFLRTCNIRLTIAHPHERTSDRCLELLQRSNQFNISGGRYDAEKFQSLLLSDQYACYTLNVSDRFGSYGIVGFAAIRLEESYVVLTEFVLSCRVAQKKVEEAFFLWLSSCRLALGEQVLRARLRITSRNEPLRSVLSELGFTVLEENEGEQKLEYRFRTPSTLSVVIETVDATVSTTFDPTTQKGAA